MKRIREIEKEKNVRTCSGPGSRGQDGRKRMWVSFEPQTSEGSSRLYSYGTDPNLPDLPKSWGERHPECSTHGGFLLYVSVRGATSPRPHHTLGKKANHCAGTGGWIRVAGLQHRPIVMTIAFPPLLRFLFSLLVFRLSHLLLLRAGLDLFIDCAPVQEWRVTDQGRIPNAKASQSRPEEDGNCGELLGQGS